MMIKLSNIRGGRMEYSLRTHHGKRKDNQDYAGLFFNQSNLVLAILCDGLGGHQAGDIASEMAVSQMGNAWQETFFSGKDLNKIEKWLRKQINIENRRIYQASTQYSDLSGMGTTLVASVILDDEILFANIGDSRAYIYKNNTIDLVTEDHSFVSELQRRGELSEEEAENHYNKNALTRSLGVKDVVEVDFFRRKTADAQIVMLSSDGLTNVTKPDEMINIFKNKKYTLEEKAEQLIETAINNNASDNITVNLIHLETIESSKVGEEK